jgi:signal recognition particle subunit SRP9
VAASARFDLEHFAVIMYIEDFASFYARAEELHRRSPLATRYVVKYRAREGKLVLKVTDDVVVCI